MVFRVYKIVGTTILRLTINSNIKGYQPGLILEYDISMIHVK